LVLQEIWEGELPRCICSTALFIKLVKSVEKLQRTDMRQRVEHIPAENCDGGGSGGSCVVSVRVVSL
jgi:hypothetical protein